MFEDDSDCNSDVGDVSDSDDAMSRNDDATLRDNDAHNRDPGGNSKRKHKPREKKVSSLNIMQYFGRALSTWSSTYYMTV